MPRRSRLHSRSPDRNAICWGYNCRCCSGNGPMSKWPLQRAWNTPNMLNRVSFLSMCTDVCVTLRAYWCVCVSALVAAFELCPGPVSKTKANKSCQPVLRVCMCVRVCMSARWCARVSVFIYRHLSTCCAKKIQRRRKNTHTHSTHSHTLTHKAQKTIYV